MGSWLRWGLVVLVLLGACGDDEEQPPQQTQAGRTTARRDSVVRQPVYPEPEAIQILRAINQHEIATARVARERSLNLDILRYASVMMADHRGITELLDSLVPPIPDTVNAESRALRQASEQVVDSLWALQGGFNNTYITEQIAAHEQALVLLDTAIIPSARNPELKKLLRDLRPTVVAHLQRARQIWAERQASGAAASTVPRPEPAAAPATPAPAPAPAPADTVPASTTSNLLR